ncbi:hypothetical protein D0T84_11385 [Dysgonomonas sp. 521]|uniref:hypothetical protein n=1 Tax=Dysgonomonas sp. 521 TaxID=2302932 RepID=UPI0013D36B2D|nr:hypothetical protein [Dysgonomonas sp. 521]NDV95507.1 hypothetical protein [Dysgonomonas sp. 521]
MKDGKKLSPKMIFGIFMVFFYLCIAVLMVFTPLFEGLNWILRVIIGILLFMYGIFRAIRAWREF